MKTTIGLEVHIQLKTRTKLFCSCAVENAEPNTRTCPICLGHPGSKPLLNKKVLDYALKLCIALGCTVHQSTFFSRKTYFYPDMSKNFQITQYEIPVGVDGSVKLKDGTIVGIERIHMEEDPAALVHEGTIATSPHVLIDYNRSGVPLLEVVTSPCMTSPAQAREFLKELTRIVQYLGIFDETCVMKADANVSITGHPRAEVKNVSGFKDVERALNYEIIRQKVALQRNVQAVQETRAWDPASRKTIHLRNKETEADYGYIFDPDLVPMIISDEEVDSIRSTIPELAHVKSERFVAAYDIDPVDAEVLASQRELGELFESIAKRVSPPLAARWLRRELLRVLNYHSKQLKEINFGADEIVEVITMIQDQTISEHTGQRIMERLMEERFSPKEFVEINKLQQLSGENELRSMCEKIIAGNDEAVRDYKNGEEKALHFLVGQVMRLSRGQADPEKTTKILKSLL